MGRPAEFKAILFAQGFTLADLAREAGVSASLVMKVSQGRRPANAQIRDAFETLTGRRWKGSWE